METRGEPAKKESGERKPVRKAPGLLCGKTPLGLRGQEGESQESLRHTLPSFCI